LATYIRFRRISAKKCISTTKRKSHYRILHWINFPTSHGCTLTYALRRIWLTNFMPSVAYYSYCLLQNKEVDWQKNHLLGELTKWKRHLITAVLGYGRTTCDKDEVSTQILSHFQLYLI
jgi:hypothetical protein